jgi:hypothetical protein
MGTSWGRTSHGTDAKQAGSSECSAAMQHAGVAPKSAIRSVATNSLFKKTSMRPRKNSNLLGACKLKLVDILEELDIGAKYRQLAEQ